jgi:hypothetical protein
MEKSLSWESNSHLTSQEIIRPLWNPKVPYRIAQEPATGPYPGPDEPSPQVPPLFP